LATVRILRSTTAGTIPSSLVSGQIAVNEGDGKLFYRSSAGVVTALPTGAPLVSHATTAGFPATGQEGALYLSVDTSKIYRWESTAYVELGAVATGVSAHASSHSTGGSDAITPANIGAVSANALLGFSNSSATVIDTVPRNTQNTAITLTSGSMILTFFTPLVTRTITQITASSGATVGSGLTLARLGLYTFDETNATLVAAVASDTSLFTTASTVYTRSLSTGGGLPSSYTLNAGSRYGFAVLATGTTMPSIIGLSSSGFNLATITPRINGQVTSQTNLPATFVVGNIAVTTNAHCARFS